jgi:hypothetical protein
MVSFAPAEVGANNADAGVRERRPTLVWWALGAAVSSRLFIFAIGFLARSSLPVPRSHAMILAQPSLLFGGTLGRLIDGWANMDAGWYLSIAQHGYAHQYGQAFFPLYPLLVHLFRDGGLGYVPAGIAVSLICFLAAAVLLYSLTAELLDEHVALWAVVFLSIAPTSFFFQAIYTESLFLLLIVALFVFAQRRHWLLAGLMGLLATLTRSTGVVLVVPLALFYLQSIEWQWRRLRAGILSVALVPCGLGLYMAYLWRASGDPLLFAKVEHRWHRYFALPDVTVWLGVKAGYAGAGKVLTEHRLFLLATYLWRSDSGVMSITNAVVLVAVVVLIALGWRRLTAPYNAYATLALIFVLLNPVAGQPLASIPRYALVIFPLYIAVAACTERRPLLRASIVFLCLVGLAWLTTRFVLFAWVA